MHNIVTVVDRIEGTDETVDIGYWHPRGDRRTHDSIRPPYDPCEIRHTQPSRGI